MALQYLKLAALNNSKVIVFFNLVTLGCEELARGLKLIRKVKYFEYYNIYFEYYSPAEIRFCESTLSFVQVQVD